MARLPSDLNDLVFEDGSALAPPATPVMSAGSIADSGHSSPHRVRRSSRRRLLGTVLVVMLAGVAVATALMSRSGDKGSLVKANAAQESTASDEGPCTFALTNALADGLAPLGDDATVGYWTSGYDTFLWRAMPTYTDAVQMLQVHGQMADASQLSAAWSEAMKIGMSDRGESVSIPTAKTVAQHYCQRWTPEAIAARAEASAVTPAPACCAGGGGTYTPDVPTAAEVAGCRSEMPRLWRGVANGSIDLDNADDGTFAGEGSVNAETAALELGAVRAKYGKNLQAGLDHLHAWCVLMPDEF